MRSMYATIKCHNPVVLYMLENGALVHLNRQTPRVGISPIDRACTGGSEALFRYEPCLHSTTCSS
ncbi:MAG: hypothetical protein SGPRY_010583 [Prymnesium sp.]